MAKGSPIAPVELMLAGVVFVLLGAFLANLESLFLALLACVVCAGIAGYALGAHLSAGAESGGKPSQLGDRLDVLPDEFVQTFRERVAEGSATSLILLDYVSVPGTRRLPFGLRTGDEVIRAVQGALRTSDHVCHLDKGRILVMLANTDAAGASNFLRRTQPMLLNRIGVATRAAIASAPQDGISLRRLLYRTSRRLAETAFNAPAERARPSLLGSR